MPQKYASVGSEAVFPLTSTLIISKLALFPAFLRDALARDCWFSFLACATRSMMKSLRAPILYAQLEYKVFLTCR
jgi:hypothetical protein